MSCETPQILGIVRAWKTRIYPSHKQEQLLWAWCAAARRTYNWAFEERIANYAAIEQAKQDEVEKENLPRRVTRFDQAKALTRLIREGGDPLHLDGVPAAIREFAVQDLDLAFQHFWRKLKQGQCPMRRGPKREFAKQYGAPENWPKLDGIDLWRRLTGWPRFKSSRDFSHSFRTRQSIKCSGSTVKLSCLAEPLRLAERLYIPVIPSEDINCATVSWHAGRWYVSVNANWQIELGEAIGRGTARIDFELPGVCRIRRSSGATELHDAPRPMADEIAQAVGGEIVIDAADPLYRILKRIRRVGRKFSRRAYDQETKRESHRRAKAREELQRIHAHIAERRAYMIHNLSTDIVQRFAHIIVHRPSLAKEIKGKKKGDGLPYNDAAWGEFCRQLKYKSEWAGVSYEESGGSHP